MDVHSDGLDLLKDGILLPHFRILSLFLSDILKDSYRVLDIDSHGAYLREVINIMCPKDIEYVSVDEDPKYVEIAKARKIDGVFRNTKYDKMKLREKSYDLIIAQNQFLKGNDIINDIDNLFRASRKWILLFNFLVLPECDGFKTININGKDEIFYGVARLRELFSVMEPKQLEYSFIVKTENPLKPTPSIFIIRT